MLLSAVCRWDVVFGGARGMVSEPIFLSFSVMSTSLPILIFPCSFQECMKVYTVTHWCQCTIGISWQLTPSYTIGVFSVFELLSHSQQWMPLCPNET